MGRLFPKHGADWHPRHGSRGWTIWPAVAIRIEAAAVFDQTPGPHAGAPLA